MENTIQPQSAQPQDQQNISQVGPSIPYKVPSFVPNNPPPQKKGNSFLLIGVLLVLFLVISIAGGAYYLGVNKTNQEEKPCPAIARICNDGSTAKLGPNCTQTCPEDSISPTPTINISNTSTWKTYTNYNIGYSIKYPGEKFFTCNFDWDNTYFSLNEKHGITDICAAGEGLPFLTFSAYEDLIKLKENDIPDCYSVIEEPIKIADFEGKRYTSNIKNDKGSCLQLSASARNLVNDVFTYNGKSFQFLYLKNDDMDMANKIISTFKFISQDQTVANWKNYKNNKYKYSIKYPKAWTLQESYVDEEDKYITTIVSPEYKYLKFAQTYRITINYLDQHYTEIYDEERIKEPKKSIPENIDGHLAVRMYPMPQYPSEIMAIEVGDNKYISISFEPYSKEISSLYPYQEDAHEIFNQILQTFQFTNSI